MVKSQRLQAPVAIGINGGRDQEALAVSFNEAVRLVGLRGRHRRGGPE
jgi:hypothetical protein